MLLIKKVTIPAKYADFSDIFLKKLIEVLPKHTGINKHAIKLEDGKQLSYKPIYSLGPVELKTLKTYIETNLANSFIQSSKSPAGASIQFVCKPNSSLQLCVDYRDLNNLTIKNQYLLPLIDISLNWLRQTKRFTLFNLTNAYDRMRIKKSNE